MINRISAAATGYPNIKPNRILEVTLELSGITDFPRPEKQWTPVRVYLATSRAQGHLALLDDQRIQSGQSAMVDIVLDSPLAVQSNDPIIIRDFASECCIVGC